MLKIPGLRKPTVNFKFISEINASNDLELSIIYERVNRNGAKVHNLQNYVIFTDTRWTNIQTIKTTIDGHLASAKGTTKVVMRYDAVRNYLHFNFDQFSGRLEL